MLARIACTGFVLLVGLGGFAGWGAAPGGPLNPLGILALAISGVIWFGWDIIQASYAYREEICPSNRGRAFLPTVRLGPVLVHRLVGRGR